MTELPQYRRILVATDGSEASVRASEHALSLARSLRASLEALAVVEVDYRVGIHLGEEVAEMEAHGQAALDRMEQAARERGVPMARLLVKGKPGPTIVRMAEERQADLIVVGAHRAGGLERALLGSTSQYVTEHASVPVLVVGEAPASRARQGA